MHELVEGGTTEAIIGAFNEVLYNYRKATNLEVGLLLHFGPVACFYREIRSNRKKDPPNPLNPPNPFEPSVIDA